VTENSLENDLLNKQNISPASLLALQPPERILVDFTRAAYAHEP
jgi:hypothetical protein